MTKDIRALTGIRGAAAAIIVLYHFGQVYLFDGGRLAYFPIPHGYLPVDLFFMLSGYVIALTYQHAFDSEKFEHFLIFLVKRVARLYPAYLAIGLLYILKIVVGLSGNDTLAMFSPYDVVGNFLMLTGWGLHIKPLMGVSWAASAEMGSYLLVPLLIAVAIRRSPLVCALVGVAAFVGIVAINASGKGANGPLDVTSGDSFYPLLRAIVGFAMGMVIFRFADHLDRLSAMMQDVLLAVVLAVIFLLAFTITADLPIYLLFIVLVALLSRDGRLAQLLFGNAPIYHIGMISYSIYLIHPLFVSFAVHGWRSFGQTGIAYVLSAGACFVVIWLLAELSYRFVEMPGRALVMHLFERKTKNSGKSPNKPTNKNAPE